MWHGAGQRRVLKMAPTLNDGQSVPDIPFNDIKTDDDNLKSLFSSIQNLAKTQKMFSIRVIKKTANGEISVPIDFESEGTKKIVYMLRPYL